MSCEPSASQRDCEIVDKVFYRDNGFVGLEALTYQVEDERFVDSTGADLSDHWPVSVTWRYATPADRRLSDPWGGSDGTNFNDVGLVPAQPTVRTLQLRSGSRVDQVGITFESGQALSHGGSGGSLKTLQLASGESLTSVRLCSGTHNGSTRIFYAAFTSDQGRTLAGGTATTSCTTYSAPSGWRIVGFHGRAGQEIDKLGVVYAPS